MWSVRSFARVWGAVRVKDRSVGLWWRKGLGHDWKVSGVSLIFLPGVDWPSWSKRLEQPGPMNESFELRVNLYSYARMVRSIILTLRVLPENCPIGWCCWLF